MASVVVPGGPPNPPLLPTPSKSFKPLCLSPLSSLTHAHIHGNLTLNPENRTVPPASEFRGSIDFCGWRKGPNNGGISDSDCTIIYSDKPPSKTQKAFTQDATIDLYNMCICGIPVFYITCWHDFAF